MRSAMIALAMLLSACASVTPINRATLEPQPAPHERPVGEDLLVLALSGGGARAASFHLGLLQQLRDTHGRDGRPLTDHIAMITSVSGGSVLSAYFALHGDEGLDSFRETYLNSGWRSRSIWEPAAWVGLVRGGANGQAQLAEWLNRRLYRDATMRDLTNGPRVILNSTDLYNYTAFAFTGLYFEGICSDLGGIRVADAVAASMAVPIIFRPVVVEAHDGCSMPGWVRHILADRSAPENARLTAQAFRNYRDLGQSGMPANFVRAGQTHLHLSDGGVVDNLGLSSLMVMRAAGPAPAPLTPREAVAARRVLIVVSNAEYLRGGRTYQTHGSDAIGLAESIAAPLDAATEAGKRNALDAFRAALPAFEREVRAFRCGLSATEAAALGAGPGWQCADFSVEMDVVSFRDMTHAEYCEFYDLDTSLSIEDQAQVDRLVAGGRGVARRNAALSRFAGQPAPAPEPESGGCPSP